MIMADSKMKDYLTVAEVAQIERVHGATVTRWIHRSLFPNARLVAKEWRIPIAEYGKWRESTKAKNLKGAKGG